MGVGVSMTCPLCGGDVPIELMITHQDAQEAFLALRDLDKANSLHGVATRYCALFAAPGRKVSPGKFARLLREVRELIEPGTVVFKGMTRAAPKAYWIEEMEAMARDGELIRPLTSHNYLRARVSTRSGREAMRAETKASEQLARGDRPSVVGAGLPAPSISAGKPAPTRPRGKRMAPEQAGAFLSSLRDAVSKHQTTEPETHTPYEPSDD